MTSQNAVQKQDYEVIADGFVAGRRRAKGDIVSMTESEAQFLVLDGLVAPAAAKDAAGKRSGKPGAGAN